MRDVAPENTPIGTAILAYLKANPEGQKTRQVARAVGKTHQIAQRYLYRLRSRQLVRVEGVIPSIGIHSKLRKEMMMNPTNLTPDFKTWASLKPGTPFNHLFPDGRVPIRSLLPITLRETGSPLCYMVPGSLLTEEQLRGLAELIWHQWQPECQSLEQAVEYIRKDALPLRTDWFDGVTCSDPGIFFTLIDGAGSEEDEQEYLDSQDNWDDSDLDEEDE